MRSPLNLEQRLQTRSRSGALSCPHHELAVPPSVQPRAKDFLGITDSCCELHNEQGDGFFKVFIYLFEREKERTSGEGTERLGDRGSEAGSVLTVESLMWGSNSLTVRS